MGAGWHRLLILSLLDKIINADLEIAIVDLEIIKSAIFWTDGEVNPLDGKFT